jgi:hypothetical protein
LPPATPGRPPPAQLRRAFVAAGPRPYDLHHVAGLAERYGLVNALARKPLTASVQTRACKFRLEEMTP